MLNKLVFVAGALMLILGVGVGLSMAAPSSQSGPNLPTPTLPAVDMSTFDVALSTVGGEEVIQSLPAASGNGITVAETSADSQYPNGIVFTTTIRSENGDVTSATLFIDYLRATSTRVNGVYDADSDTWTAHLWDQVDQISPWTLIYARWSITDASGATLETERQLIEYVDETRTWYLANLSSMDVYWYGATGSRTPEAFATDIGLAIAQTDVRRAEVFGSLLDYRPRAIIFPSQAGFYELYHGQPDVSVGGYTLGDQGIIVQWFFSREELEGAFVEGPREFGEGDCRFFRIPTDTYDLAEQWVVEDVIFRTVPHELGHIYQYEFDQPQGLIGSNWWGEGQAVWLQAIPDPSDERLRALARLDPAFIPLIQNIAISREARVADNCPYLVYSAGHSFINYMLATYGGTETAYRISENLRGGMMLYDAIEAATGADFLTIENGWRAYLGFDQLLPEDLDPALMLEDAPNAAFPVGSSVVIPGPRPVTLKEQVGGRIGQAQCFAGTMIAVLRVGTLDGVEWYEVDCNGLRGWVTVDDLQ